MMRRILWRFRGEKPLFSTHRAPFQEPEHEVGSLVEWEGRLYRITRWLERPRVHLPRGGSVAEWQVWGKELSQKDVERYVEQVTAEILEKAATDKSNREGS